MSYLVKYGDIGISLFGDSWENFYICIKPDTEIWDFSPEDFMNELLEALEAAKDYHKVVMMEDAFSTTSSSISYLSRCFTYDQVRDYLENPMATSVHHRNTAILLLQYLKDRETKKGLRRAADKSLRQKILERDHRLCRYCGDGIEDNSPLDHVIPYSLGGLTNEDNLVTCCKPCNSRKAGKTLTEIGMTLLPIKGNNL